MTIVSSHGGPRAGTVRTPLWLLALITLSGTLAMHIFVPALPVAAKALGAPTHATQLTLSTYIVGLAVGQLGYGPAGVRASCSAGRSCGTGPRAPRPRASSR